MREGRRGTLPRFPPESIHCPVSRMFSNCGPVNIFFDPQQQSVLADSGVLFAARPRQGTRKHRLPYVSRAVPSEEGLHIRDRDSRCFVPMKGLPSSGRDFVLLTLLLQNHLRSPRESRSCRVQCSLHGRGNLATSWLLRGFGFPTCYTQVVGLQQSDRDSRRFVPARGLPSR